MYPACTAPHCEFMSLLADICVRLQPFNNNQHSGSKRINQPLLVWHGKERGSESENEREKEREQEEREAPGTLTAALQISEPKSEALMVSSVHISHTLKHAHTCMRT